MKVAITPQALVPCFTEQDAHRAFDEWGANCGPGAIAGMLHLTLDEVRPHMGDFEAKGYTNPTLMKSVLNKLGVPFRLLHPPVWPKYGLVRVQWEGPWTEPGVPMAARYRYTHWIGACGRKPDNIGIFDINCMNNGAGWVSLDDWANDIAPHLTGNYRRAYGTWHITHALELEATP